MKLILNAITTKNIDRLSMNPSHALIVASQDDLYNIAIARHLTSNILGKDPLKYAHYKEIVPIKNSIGIDQAREINAFLKLKVPSKDAINRICVITQANLLTIESQNALLKNLEEPNQGCLIILCTRDKNMLLQTVRSRCQSLLVSFPALEDIQSHLVSEGYTKTEIQKAFNQAGGLPELTSAILSDSEHPVIFAAEQAKTMLQMTRFERLTLVNSIKDKDSAKQLAQMLIQIARLGIKSDKDKKWQLIHSSAFECLKMLEANTQPKLALTKLNLSF